MNKIQYGWYISALEFVVNLVKNAVKYFYINTDKKIITIMTVSLRALFCDVVLSIR